MTTSWKRLVVAAGVVLPAIALAGCGADDPTAGASSGDRRSPISQGPIQSRPGPAATLPAGWKWESFRHVQVGVPEGWHDGASTAQLTTQWCISDKASRAIPWVARPGASTLAGCFSPDGSDPGTLIAEAGTFVAFEDALELQDGVRHEGDRTTVTVDGISVLIQAPAPLRQRIAKTLSTFTTDPHGCAPTHPLSRSPERPPAPAMPLRALTGVSSVSACKYLLSSAHEPSAGGLVSSLRLTGEAAAAAMTEVTAAPTGGGPNSPSSCLEEVAYGDEAIALVVRSDQGVSQLYLRYDGCDHHGFFDGTTTRRLTRQSVAPFIGGANSTGPMMMSRSMLPILGVGPTER